MNQTENVARGGAPNNRVLSGMRPTGRLHLGHYHGVLKNWLRLQDDYECFFFVADWHALTTHYDQSDAIDENGWQMVIDWLAAGVDPNRATLFIQSRVIEHAELHLLLSMVTPLGWLERVPSFKEQQQKLRDRDLATYGFLGYPLLQSADILMYRAGYVPVGEDQAPHVELTREIARRFNHFYGQRENEQVVDEAIARLEQSQKGATKKYLRGRKLFTEKGDKFVYNETRLWLFEHAASPGDIELLLGHLEGRGRAILPEPETLLTESAKMSGLDGQKMSKSYNNQIALRDEPARVREAIAKMPTDPARARRTDPGEPEKCPVWPLHKAYSNAPMCEWVAGGCRSAAIGCLECKQPLIDAVLAEQAEFAERAQHYVDRPAEVREVIAAGTDRARAVARETMAVVREVVGLGYE